MFVNLIKQKGCMGSNSMFLISPPSLWILFDLSKYRLDLSWSWSIFLAALFVDHFVGGPVKHQYLWRSTYQSVGHEGHVPDTPRGVSYNLI